MAKEKKKKRVMSFSLDPELEGLLDEVAEGRGWSRSQVVERVLFEGLEEEQKRLRQIENPAFQLGARLMAATGGVETVAAIFDGMTVEEGKKLRLLFLEQLDRGKDRRKEKKGNRGDEGLAGA